MSKVKQATTFRDGPLLPAHKAACMVGFGCTHFGLLMAGASPTPACVGPKQVRLSLGACMGTFGREAWSGGLKSSSEDCSALKTTTAALGEGHTQSHCTKAHWTSQQQQGQWVILVGQAGMPCKYKSLHEWNNPEVPLS